jgi:hypothetical protein
VRRKSVRRYTAAAESTALQVRPLGSLSPSPRRRRQDHTQLSAEFSSGGSTASARRTVLSRHLWGRYRTEAPPTGYSLRFGQDND